MADDVTVDNGGLTDYTAATDDVAGRHFQRVKLDLGDDGETEPVVGTLPVEVIHDGSSLYVNEVGQIEVGNFPETQPVSGALEGDVAHDIADSGNPVKIGGKARSGFGTAVANNDRVNAWFGLHGEQNIAIRDPDDGYGLLVNSLGQLEVGNFPATQPVTDNGGSLTVDGTVGVSGTVVVDGSGVTQPISGTVTVNEPVSVDDNGGSLTVDGTVAVTNAALTELAAAIDTELQVDVVGALPAGTNNIGDVDVVSLPAIPAGTNNIGDVDVLTLPAIPAGNNNIGDVDIASIAAGDNNIGNVDIVTMPNVTIGAAIPAGTNAIGKLAANSGVDIGDVDVTSVPAPLSTAGNGTAATAHRVTIASDSTGVVGLAAGTNAIGKLAANSGVDIGDVDVTSLPALPAGTNNIGDVDVLTLPGVAGDVAHDAGDSGNPVKIGGFARATSPAVVADGDRVNAWLGQNGTQAVAWSTGASSLGDAVNGTVTSLFGTTAATTQHKVAALNLVYNGTDWDRLRGDTLGVHISRSATAATATLTNVNDTASSTTLLAANTSRKGATIHNDSTAILYVKFGATASSTSYTVKLVADAYYEVPFGYTGIIDGIWASDAAGAARITEMT